MVGRLYHLGRGLARERAPTSCSSASSSPRRRDRLVKTYSGGMRRRLDLAAALVAARRCCSSTSRPPASTRGAATSLWDDDRGLVADGTTVLLTTQYLDEADRLADASPSSTTARVIAEGTSDELKDRVGGERLEVA